MYMMFVYYICISVSSLCE